MKWTNKGHQFDQIGELFEDMDGVIVYGAGMYGKEVFDMLKSVGAICAFADGDENKQKNGYLGLRVLPPQSIKEFTKGKRYIIVVAASGTNGSIILKQLLTQGYVHGKNLFDFNSFINFYIYIMAVYKYNKCIMTQCAPMGVYQCTLRCKNCVGSFPYFKNKKNVSFQSIKRDVDIMFSKIDYIRYMGIGCGEPFLYKDLKEYIKYVVDNYSQQFGEYAIVTNGTILPDEELLDFIKEYGVSIRVSNYVNVKGWQQKYERFVEYLNRHEIEIVDYVYDKWVDFGWQKPRMERNDDTISKIFNACAMDCRVVQNGKLYYCIHALTTNQALYGLDFPEDEIDLSKNGDNMKKIILEYHLGYNNNGFLKMCGYCDGTTNVNSNYVPAAEQLEA